MMEGWLPYFRAGKWKKMRGLLPNGEVTEEHLKELERNGNELIEKKIMQLPVGPDHQRSGDAWGWIKGFKAVGRVLYWLPEWNDLGKEAIQNRRRRQFSAEIRNNFNTTGEDGGAILKGLCPIGGALLGRDLPEQKGLVDLSEAIVFSEGRVVADHLVVDGETIFYTEVMEEVDEMELEELKKQIEALTTRVTAAESRATAAETALEEERKKSAAATKDAEMSEHRTAVREKLNVIKSKKKLGTELMTKAEAFFAKLHAADRDLVEFSESKESLDLEKDFSEFLESLPVIGDFKQNLDSKDDDSGELVEADFSEAVTNATKAKKIQSIVDERRKTNEKFTMSDLLKEVKNRK